MTSLGFAELDVLFGKPCKKKGEKKKEPMLCNYYGKQYEDGLMADRLKRREYKPYSVEADDYANYFSEYKSKILENKNRLKENFEDANRNGEPEPIDDLNRRFMISNKIIPEDYRVKQDPEDEYYARIYKNGDYNIYDKIDGTGLNRNPGNTAYRQGVIGVDDESLPGNTQLAKLYKYKGGNMPTEYDTHDIAIDKSAENIRYDPNNQYLDLILYLLIGTVFILILEMFVQIGAKINIVPPTQIYPQQQMPPPPPPQYVNVQPNNTYNNLVPAMMYQPPHQPYYGGYYGGY
jgi:hypothetical protein